MSYRDLLTTGQATRRHVPLDSVLVLLIIAFVLGVWWGTTRLGAWYAVYKLGQFEAAERRRRIRR